MPFGKAERREAHPCKTQADSRGTQKGAGSTQSSTSHLRGSATFPGRSAQPTALTVFCGCLFLVTLGVVRSKQSWPFLVQFNEREENDFFGLGEGWGTMIGDAPLY